MKLIELTGKYGSVIGNYVQVDDENYEELSKYEWYCRKVKKTYYALRWTNTGIIIMHRMLLKITNPELVGDHIDHNGLNNQKNNIRIATKSQNMANLICRSNTSKYKGVTLCKNKKWKVDCTKDGIGHYKYCRSEIEAALWYNEKARELHGEFAYINNIQKEDLEEYNKWKVNNPKVLPDTDTHKRCRKCQEHKELTMFHIQKTKKDGRNIYCKECIKFINYEDYKNKKLK